MTFSRSTLSLSLRQLSLLFFHLSLFVAIATTDFHRFPPIDDDLPKIDSLSPATLRLINLPNTVIEK
ncbi:hypothetical protein ACSBR2_006660 [Camellia fascicularis]